MKWEKWSKTSRVPLGGLKSVVAARTSLPLGGYLLRPAGSRPRRRRRADDAPPDLDSQISGAQRRRRCALCAGRERRLHPDVMPWGRNGKCRSERVQGLQHGTL